MNEDEKDRVYEEGFQAAMRVVLAAIVNRMPDGNAERWRLERGQAVAALRDVCEDFGDNDWPDELHLADVIEKHLGRALHGAKAEGKTP